MLEKQSTWKCRQHSRIELKGWGCWRNIRGTNITLEEARALVRATKARIKQDELDVFDWDLTDRDQGKFDTKDDGLSVFQRGGHSHGP